MKTATATFSPLTILCASILLFGSAFAAHAFDDSDLYMTPAISSSSATADDGGRVIDTRPRMITDVETGQTTTIIPVLPARTNPGLGVYMNQETGQEFMVIENTYGAH